MRNRDAELRQRVAVRVLQLIAKRNDDLPAKARVHQAARRLPGADAIGVAAFLLGQQARVNHARVSINVTWASGGSPLSTLRLQTVEFGAVSPRTHLDRSGLFLPGSKRAPAEMERISRYFLSGFYAVDPTLHKIAERSIELWGGLSRRQQLFGGPARRKAGGELGGQIQVLASAVDDAVAVAKSCVLDETNPIDLKFGALDRDLDKPLPVLLTGKQSLEFRAPTPRSLFGDAATPQCVIEMTYLTRAHVATPEGLSLAPSR